jgi:hypothetical protein
MIQKQLDPRCVVSSRGPEKPGPVAVVVSVPLVKTITLHPTLARAEEVRAYVERQLRRVKAWPNCEVIDLREEVGP